MKANGHATKLAIVKPAKRKRPKPPPMQTYVVHFMDYPHPVAIIWRFEAVNWTAAFARAAFVLPEAVFAKCGVEPRATVVP